ncbi:magnesium chelatase subunit D family protein [Rhodococcus antarcticus]|uniref:Magnesium chelatase subunit D family protein n=1 Tax=Rhodococcus antarcticus TaxID=2987751 RepID=A0ABY6P395_9NOCA|nr:magnesium chelatase subunit D family protein [Rhodococcus antarcticus]UZJ25751.1 magnesium chelatase subunit D family protein [Rhodococcus antarcticus]
MQGFPFSAVVGQDQLRLALLLNAVHPGIGGVLVRGEKGTAKSTVVRALAALMPHGRLVELPIGATEDRVVGSLDLQRVLRDGEAAFQPGLLAAAHEGVLYVDEVNLLHDHLVDVLLDAAAMGRVHVERDGVSHSHDARFVLVGTMNPEEGELRPQLLDRFGLAVEVAASREVAVRVEVVRRRLAYEDDADAFAARYAEADGVLAQQILDARARLPHVVLTEGELRRIAALCASFDVDGMRADLVLARTALAHAAWRGAASVDETDVRVAAELALPHRRRRDPFDAPGIEPEQLDEAMRDAAEHAQEREPDPDPTPPEGGGEPDPTDGPAPEQPAVDGDAVEGDAADGEPAGEAEAPPSPEQPAPQERPAGEPGAQFRTRRLEVPGLGEGAPGRRSRSRSDTGRTVRSQTGTGRGLHLVHTVLAAAPHQGSRGRTDGPLRLDATDLRRPVREGREGNLVLFVVDASGSMASRDRLTAVTGAAMSLLRDAYQRRDKVGVISLRGSTAELVLPPTGSVDTAATRLRRMTTGGRTPLAAGLLEARRVLASEAVRDPQRRPLLVVLTDGRATGGTDPVPRAQAAAGLLRARGTAAVVIDCESGVVRLGLAAELATSLGAACVRLDELSAEQVGGVVRAAAA